MKHIKNTFVRLWRSIGNLSRFEAIVLVPMFIVPANSLLITPVLPSTVAKAEIKPAAVLSKFIVDLDIGILQ
jgi:hypothetical protein